MKVREKSKEQKTISELIESFQDVSNELSNRIKELEELALRYEMALEAAPTAMIVVNQSGEIVLANKQTENLFGHTRQELVGQSISILVPEIIRPQHPKLFASFFDDPRTRSIGVGQDLAGQRKDGSQMPVEIRLNPIETKEGILVMASIADITERKKSEQMIKQKQEDLVRSNKDLEEFAYIASHDLKAPLRAIGNIGQWLINDLHDVLEEDKKTIYLDDETREEIKDNLFNLVVRSNLMEALLNDLLTYSQVGKEYHAVEEVDFKVLVNNIVELQGISRNFKIKVIEAPKKIKVEKAPLEIVLRNLISNAVKHHDKSEGKIEMFLEDQGGQYQFSVKDDGPGIPIEHHEKVFELFQTLKPKDKVEGSGIGMTIIKKIIEFYGGVVNVKSPGARRGTTITFTWKKV